MSKLPREELTLHVKQAKSKIQDKFVRKVTNKVLCMQSQGQHASTLEAKDVPFATTS